MGEKIENIGIVKRYGGEFHGVGVFSVVRVYSLSKVQVSENHSWLFLIPYNARKSHFLHIFSSLCLQDRIVPPLGKHMKLSPCSALDMCTRY